MSKSTKRRTSGKPAKPYADFPLFPHATGRWAKKIRQKFHYFGRIEDDPNGTAALERFNSEWPYLKDGRTPPPVDTGEGCTVKLLCNSFLTSKLAKLNADELSRASFTDYHRTCELLVTHFGRDRRIDDLRPDDFERLRSALSKRWGVVTLKNEINRIRVVLKYAFDQRLVERPVHFGQSFNRPSAKALRKSRNEAGPRLFELGELRLILDAIAAREVTTASGEKITLKADPMLRAMVLLGANCGFGNTDVAGLPLSAVDLDTGWCDFPRPKTEIRRRVPLWAETIDALRKAIALRPEPKDKADADLCFITVQGNRWVRIVQKRDEENLYVKRDNITSRFGKLLKRLEINDRRGLGFYTLRHVFETIGGESKDQVAVDAIMGHADHTMAAQYRERISDERLMAVTDTVHQWLYGK